MALRFAVLLDPAASDDPRTDFRDTFTRVDPGEPALELSELSAQRGDGVFESIGVADGHPQEVEAHLERLAHSALLCDLAEPHLGQWRAAISEVVAHAGGGEAVVKLILSRGRDDGHGPTAWATVSSAADFARVRAEGIRVVTLDRGIDSGAAGRAPWLLLGAKTLSYAVNMAALREAHRRGADDAIFVSSDGIVLEAPTASVILRVGETYVTPAPRGSILHGTTQLSVFAWLEEQGSATAYREVPASALPRADAAWLVSSVRLAAPITAIDGTPLAVDHGFTDRLNAYLLSPRE
ncbi:aminodeoxychorismate lyase [Microbacterium sp. P01]|uniref:aminodeoxychorismate lyase n=1 Tax=Microbacterium sp. P01 TaxID=3366261 RepID=UPI00366D9A82